MMIIVGFTQSDRANDYFPAMDGYRDDAEQVLVPLRLRDDAAAGVTVPQGLTGIQWAHALFAASNLPPEAYGAGQEPPAVTAIRHALETEPPKYWQSMSIGDTITVNGEVWACGRGSSWELVGRTMGASHFTHAQVAAIARKLQTELRGNAGAIAAVLFGEDR